MKLPPRFLERYGTDFLIPVEAERSLWTNQKQVG
jgi:hypothetical protein